MAQMTMAELLAKNEAKQLTLTRGQEVEGRIIALLQDELVIDLGAKSEGILKKQDLRAEEIDKLKVGDKIQAYILSTENESGQVILGLQKEIKGGTNFTRYARFEAAKKNNQTLTGKGLEVNKGGLIIEVNGVRGFLPSSQVSLSQAGNLEQLVGRDIQVNVIELDLSQNRLIFTQKVPVSDDLKQKLEQLEIGSTVSCEVTSLLPFGVLVKIGDGVDGLIHISELSWDKVEDPSSLYKIGDRVDAKVLTVDLNTGKVNLSVKQLSKDPFSKLTENYKPDEVVEGLVSKITPQGVNITLSEGLEGFVPANKIEEEYSVGQKISCIIDSIDNQKRRINLTPFITSTKDLIYK